MSLEDDIEDGGEEPNLGGRPTKYKKEYANQAKKLCELGATDSDLADFFGVCTRTIWRWSAEHKAFCQALKVGKGSPDDRVERSLFQRAVGYSYNSVKFHAYEGAVTQTPCIEHVPPDPGAAKLWLANRRPKEWRERLEIEPGQGFKQLWTALATGKVPELSAPAEGDGDDD